MNNKYGLSLQIIMPQRTGIISFPPVRNWRGRHQIVRSSNRSGRGDQVAHTEQANVVKVIGGPGGCVGSFDDSVVKATKLDDKVMPAAFAVLRLMTNRYHVGSSNRRSPGSAVVGAVYLPTRS
jgi:hypothetical protein